MKAKQKANGLYVGWARFILIQSINHFLPAELQSINKRKAMRVNGRNHITHSILASTSLHCFPLCSNHSVSFPAGWLSFQIPFHSTSLALLRECSFHSICSFRRQPFTHFTALIVSFHSKHSFHSTISFSFHS